MDYSVETCRVERRDTDPQLATQNHITSSVRDALVPELYVHCTSDHATPAGRQSV